jgi:hypothetical protein
VRRDPDRDRLVDPEAGVERAGLEGYGDGGEEQQRERDAHAAHGATRGGAGRRALTRRNNS